MFSREVSSSQEGEDDDRYHKDRRKDSKKYKNVDHNGEFSHTGYTKDSSHTGDSAGKIRTILAELLFALVLY